MAITYCHLNRTYKYTPDFLVQRKDKIQLIEIKPQSKLQNILRDDFLLKKYTAAAYFCKSNGYSEFKIVTDKEIQSGNMLKNIKYLFSFSKLDTPASVRIKFRNVLMLSGSQQIIQVISSICENENDSSKYYAYILSMLYHQEIKTDLLEPISKKSLIKL